MVDTVDSKSTGEIRAGSSPVSGTICLFTSQTQQVVAVF